MSQYREASQPTDVVSGPTTFTWRSQVYGCQSPHARVLWVPSHRLCRLNLQNRLALRGVCVCACVRVCVCACVRECVCMCVKNVCACVCLISRVSDTKHTTGTSREHKHVLPTVSAMAGSLNSFLFPNFHSSLTTLTLKKEISLANRRFPVSHCISC